MALLAVLIFTALMFILASGMLIGASREIFIAGLHRDAVMAEESALAGIEEALLRMHGGRPWRPGAFPVGDRCLQDDAPGVRMGLAAADVCLAVVTRRSGPSGGILELRSEGSSSRARRRLAAAVVARTATALPDVLVLDRLAEGPGMEVESGVIHVRTSATYLSAVSAERTTYAGWKISHAPAPPGGTGPCYTHADCAAAGRPQWWPGHRRAAYAGRPLRSTAQAGNSVSDPRDLSAVLAYDCPGGPPPVQALQTIGTDGPGFQIGDQRADLHPGDPLQSAIAGEPLYGCTTDGLPFTWVREAFDTEDDPDADPDQFLWFTTVRFDQWLARYGCFDERALVWFPCNGFHTDPARGDPSLGAVHPELPDDVWAQNYDRRVTGGGAVTARDLDLGRCTDPPLCADVLNVRPTVALTAGNYVLLCGETCADGLGVLLVGGDLTISGSLTFHGIVAVNGVLTVAAGQAVTIHGMLSADRLASPGAVLRLAPGTQVAAGVAGPAAVVRKSWWER